MKRNAAYYQNLLIYSLAALLYAMALSYMATRLVQIEMNPLHFLPLYLIALMAILIIFTYPFISLGVLSLIGAYVGIRVLDDGAYLVELINTPLVKEIESTVRAAMLYFGAQNLIVPDVSYYIHALQVLSVLLGVILLWRLPLPHFALILLVAPLFFMPGFLLDRTWVIWLFVGLFAVMVSFSMRYDVRGRLRKVRQLPPLLPIAVLLLLTLGLGSVLPSGLFFSDSLSRWVNRVDDRFTSDSGLDNRGLVVNYGGYYANNAPMNGLVSRVKTPYLRVLANPQAFYLRGTVYEEFRNLAWQAPDTSPSEVFRNNTKTIVQRNSFGNPPSDERKKKLYWEDQILVLPLSLPSKVVYIGNIPATIHSVDLQLSGAEDLPLHERYKQADIMSYGNRERNSNYNFTYQGQVFKSNSQSTDGYVVNGWFVPVETTRRYAALREEGFSPRPFSLDIRNKLDRRPLTLDSTIVTDRYGDQQWNAYLPGNQEYRELVEQYDPVLASILYRPLSNQTEKMQVVIDVTEHLKNNYTYNLEVEDIPRRQSFMEWFLEGKEGYCVHFGTALTFLLQDVDINARYVEGFLVKQAPEGSSDHADRIVTTDSAHAWTEVDIQGIGWYPFDATPPGQLSQLVSSQTPGTQTSTSEPVNNEEIIPEIRRPTPPPTTEPIVDTADPEADDAPQADFPWLLVVLLVLAGFLSWRYVLCKRRHDHAWLRRRYAGREDELVRRVFKDILYLHRISGYQMPAVWSHLARFREVLERYAALDEQQAALALRAIEEVYYAERMPSDAQVEGLLQYHEQLEKRIQQKLPAYEWIGRRFLFSPGHPI